LAPRRSKAQGRKFHWKDSYPDKRKEINKSKKCVGVQTTKQPLCTLPLC